MKTKLTIHIFFFLFLLLTGCSRTSCNDKIKNLIDEVENHQLEELYGYSAIIRGNDNNNKPYVSRIEYRRSDGSVVSLPSFQKVKSRRNEQNLSKQKDQIDYGQLTHLVGLKTNDPRRAIENKCRIIAEIFHQFDLIEIRSSKNAEDYVVFRFEDQCSVWYFSEEWLNQNDMVEIEKKGIKLNHSWYIVHELSTKEQIKNYKIR